MSRKTDSGTIQIHNAVVATIAALAAQEVQGVVEVWRGANPLKWISGNTGVRVSAQDQDLRLWLSLVVEYGVDLPSVAAQVQDRVREMIERTTHLTPLEVNVSIHHVKSKGG